MDIVREILPQVIAGLVVAGIVGLGTWFFTRASIFGSKLSIMEPRNRDEVPYKFIVKGTYSDKLDEYDLWIVVVPHGERMYHPQPGPVKKFGDNRTWQGESWTGRSKDENIGEFFDIFAYPTKMSASQEFNDYVQKQYKEQQWRGLHQLPSGCLSPAQITVRRVRN